MSVVLNEKEKEAARALALSEANAGSHSPSPSMLGDTGGLQVKYDFCYLSNPYASELFVRYFRDAISQPGALEAIVELYPSQNRALAKKISSVICVAEEKIFLGNGATEVIQAVMQNFVSRKMLVPIPTFSPYIEFAQKGVAVAYHHLRKEDGFVLRPDALLATVAEEKPDAVVIINPNNPDGGYLPAVELESLLERLREIPAVILDESFIHFVAPASEPAPIHDSSRLLEKFPNLIIIKSLSKDFGIAGIRLGYALAAPERVSSLLDRGYLWNISGFGEYAINLLAQKDFQNEYEMGRKNGIKARDIFYSKLREISGITVYPSMGNFFLMELTDGSKADDLVVALLVRHEIYIRSCKNKVGLEGEFVRIASRTENENEMMVQALISVLK